MLVSQLPGVLLSLTLIGICAYAMSRKSSFEVLLILIGAILGLFSLAVNVWFMYSINLSQNAFNELQWMPIAQGILGITGDLMVVIGTSILILKHLKVDAPKQEGPFIK